jgi:hypothetical protein
MEVAQPRLVDGHCTTVARVPTARLAAPVLFGLGFLLYCMPRFLTYVQQRRWRAVAVLPVIGVCAAAIYAMFFLYFIAGHAGNTNTRELLALGGILWGAIAVYASLGWGLHYAVRR